MMKHNCLKNMINYYGTPIAINITSANRRMTYGSYSPENHRDRSHGRRTVRGHFRRPDREWAYCGFCHQPVLRLNDGRSHGSGRSMEIGNGDQAIRQ